MADYGKLIETLLMLEREHISVAADSASYVVCRNGIPRMTLREAINFYEHGTTSPVRETEGQ